MSDPVYIRFDGRLREDLQFERRLGWETPVIVRRAPEGDGEFAIDLRDDQGDVLVSVPVEADFDSGCNDEAHEMRTARIVGHIPLHADAHELVLHRKGRAIHREAVAPEPPTIDITTVEQRDNGRIKLEWSAKHPTGARLQYRVLFVSSDGKQRRGFPVVMESRRTSAVVDTRSLPGGRACQLTVLATDGLRSAVAVSKPFKVAEPDATVVVQAPIDRATVSSAQPVTACGRAYDAGGAALPLDGLTWRLDGDLVSEGECLIALHDLEPGTHRIELSWLNGGGKAIAESRSFTVAAESKAQAELRSILDEISD